MRTKYLQHRSFILPAVGIFALAVLVGVVYNLTVARDYFPLHDSLAYQELAFHLLDEHCYCWQPHLVTVSHAPLWPFLIAGLSLVVGRADIFDRLFLCLVNAGTCVLIYAFVRDLFGKRLGLLAGLFACVYPGLFIYTGWLYTEALFTFLLMAACYTVLHIQRTQGRDRRHWLLGGVLLGLLALCHPNGQLVGVLFILWVVLLVWRQRLPRQALVGGALAVGMALALIVPWCIRDYVAAHTFVDITAGSGSVLLGAYNDLAVTDPAQQGSWVESVTAPPQVTAPFAGHPCAAPCEIAEENTKTVLAEHWATSHLNEMPLLLFYRLRNFLTPYSGEADMPMNRFPAQLSSQLVHKMSQTLPIPVVLLAFFGLIATFRRWWPKLLFAYLVIGGTVAENLLFYGSSRLRAPIEPLLIVLAAGALRWLVDTMHARQPVLSRSITALLSAFTSLPMTLRAYRFASRASGKVELTQVRSAPQFLVKQARRERSSRLG